MPSNQQTENESQQNITQELEDFVFEATTGCKIFGAKWEEKSLSNFNGHLQQVFPWKIYNSQRGRKI